MIFDALQPQDFVLGGAALALGGLQFVLGSGQLTVCRLLSCHGLRELFMHTGGTAAQLLQLGGTAQHARAAGRGTAGHGTAPVDDLTVQRHDTEGVFIFAGHGDAAVHILGDDRAAQEIVENVLILAVKLHQTGGKAHKAELVLHALLPQFVAADGGERQEGGASAVSLLEEVDGALGVLFPVHHDILQSRAQGDLDGQGVFTVGLHQVCHRPVDAPQAILRLHDNFHSLVETLVVLFHLRQHTDPVVQRAHVHGQAHFLLRGGGGLLAALVHTQRVAGDDVGHGSCLVLRVFQRAAVGFGLLAGALQLLLRGGDFRFHGSLPLSDLAVFGGDGGGFRSGVRGGGHSHGLLTPQRLRLALGAARLLGCGTGLIQQFLQCVVQFGDPRLHTGGDGLLLLCLRFQTAGTAVRLRQFNSGTVNILPLVGNGALQHGHGALLFADAALQFSGLGTDALRLHVLLPHFFTVALTLGKEVVHGRAGLVPLRFGGVEIQFQLAGVHLQAVQILQPDGNLQQTQLVAQHQIFLRLLRLIPQRLHLQLQFGDLVVDAHQILFRTLQLPLRLLLAVAELGDAGGLLEDLAALAALGGEDLIDAALTDDGIALTAHAGIHEQLRHVTQADGLAVDVIFTFTAAVIAAGHGDFALLHGGEDMLRVVDDQGDLCEAHLIALFRAAEDHVLHLGAAEALGALFAHDPADSVGNVGFTGAVGAHDGGDILTEIQDRLVRKGLEALDLQCF